MTQHVFHWMTWTRIYRIWKCMKSRCNWIHQDDYKNYWWRWIKILRKDFQEFYDDMWDSYRDNLTIERKDVNWHYCKDNCCRITNQEQQNNRRDNILLTYKWITKTKQQRWDILWIPKSTMGKRIKKWWPIEKVLSCERYKKWHHKFSIV